MPAKLMLRWFFYTIAPRSHSKRTIDSLD